MAAGSWRVHGNLVRPDGQVRRGTVTVAGGQIVSLADEDSPRPDPGSPLLATPPEAFVGPGLIDLHMHGANGSDFMAAEPDGAHQIAAFAARHGVTGMLASAVTATGAAISAALRSIAQAISDQAASEQGASEQASAGSPAVAGQAARGPAARRAPRRPLPEPGTPRRPGPRDHPPGQHRRVPAVGGPGADPDDHRGARDRRRQ
jgi:imidazolonepropionase-like amidohydrolase